MKTSFGPKSIDRNPDKNYEAFWSKRCLHKIISVFTDLYYK